MQPAWQDSPTQVPASRDLQSTLLPAISTLFELIDTLPALDFSSSGPSRRQDVKISSQLRRIHIFEPFEPLASTGYGRRSGQELPFCPPGLGIFFFESLSGLSGTKFHLIGNCIAHGVRGALDVLEPERKMIPFRSNLSMQNRKTIELHGRKQKPRKKRQRWQNGMIEDALAARND